MARNKVNKKDEVFSKLTNDELFGLSEDLDGIFITDRIELILIEIYGYSNNNTRLILSDDVRKELTKRIRSLCTTVIPRM